MLCFWPRFKFLNWSVFISNFSYNSNALLSFNPPLVLFTISLAVFCCWSWIDCVSDCWLVVKWTAEETVVATENRLFWLLVSLLTLFWNDPNPILLFVVLLIFAIEYGLTCVFISIGILLAVEEVIFFSKFFFSPRKKEFRIECNLCRERA